MSNPVFPAALAAKQDSKYFNVELEDVALKSEMEGGYTVSRARHTREPRSIFTSGFTEISTADYEILKAFYKQVRGGSVIFDYTDPSTAKTGGTPVVYAVRFEGPLKVTYKGIGKLQMWDIQFTVKQA